MYYRERDYNWIFDTKGDATAIDSVYTRDTISNSSTDNMIEYSVTSAAPRLGRTKAEWNNYIARKSFAQLITDHNRSTCI